MPYIGNIVQDFSVNNAMLNTDSVTSIKIDDGTIVNADINDSAAIDGTKISANFGTQNITSAGKLRLNPSDNSTTWQRENKHLHQIRDDIYVQSTVNVGDEAGFDFTPLAISAFSYSGTTLTLTTASHTIAVGANILIKDSASGFQEAFNTISGTTGTTIKVTRSSDPSSSLSTANTKVIVYTPADPRGCINVAKDYAKFNENSFNPILRSYVGKDLTSTATSNTEVFKVEVKKDSSATDHVATLLHSTREFGAGQRLALTIDDGNSYPDGKNLVLTQNGVKITADDSAFTDSDELLEVEGNAKIDGNLEITGTVTAGGDGTISGDELFLTDSIKHVGDTDTSISFPSNDLIRFRTGGFARLDIDSNGKVGIGTTSPTALLHVDSDSTTAGIRITGDGNAFLELDADSSVAGTQISFIDFKLAGTVEANIAVNESVSGNPLELNSATDHNISMVTGGGKVGIGTSSPGGSLDIGGNTDNNIQAIMTRASDTNFQLQFRNESTSNNVSEPQGKFGLFYLTNDIVGLQFARGSSTGAGSLLFTTGGEVKMRFNSSGYLGIGTSHIEAPLSVARDVAESASFNLDNNQLMLRNSGSADTASRTSLYFRTHAADNKLSPSGIRCIAGSNYQSILAFHTNGNGNGTGHIENYERMRIDGAGAVGIGTTSPGYTLHVKGGIVDQTARFDNTKTNDGDINYIGIGINSLTTGSALFGHTGHTTTGSQAAWMGLGGDDVAGGVGVKCFRGGAVHMAGTLRINTTTQYGQLHVKEDGFNPNTSTWLTNASYVASSSFGGGYCLLDGSKGYSLYCHGSGAHFAIQHHSSTTATASGGVELLNAATSWSAASDERDKENLVTISDAITKIKTLRTVIGNYTWQPDIKHAFLIAQDVQAVLPEAVDIRNTYEETENQRLSLRYTEIIPLLTAALQEAVAEIDTLKTKVAVLEAA